MSEERGETLLELLVAVTILGVVVVALVGGLRTSVLMSDLHRKQATAGAVVRDYAEAIEASVGTGGYVACATTASYVAPTGFSPPAGFTRSVVAGSMRYWNGTAWQPTCGTDSGLQRLTIAVTSTDGRADERLTIVVRKPCRVVDALCA
jgi:prepilin-type N-terminal cleavage/methylation domain-containing protein